MLYRGFFCLAMCVLSGQVGVASTDDCGMFSLPHTRVERLEANFMLLDGTRVGFMPENSVSLKMGNSYVCVFEDELLFYAGNLLAVVVGNKASFRAGIYDLQRDAAIEHLMNLATCMTDRQLWPNRSESEETAWEELYHSLERNDTEAMRLCARILGIVAR